MAVDMTSDDMNVTNVTKDDSTLSVDDGRSTVFGKEKKPKKALMYIMNKRIWFKPL